MGSIDEQDEAHRRFGPVYFTSLRVAGVRCFGPEQTLNLVHSNRPAKWTVILGENGVGKAPAAVAVAVAVPAAAAAAAAAARLRLRGCGCGCGCVVRYRHRQRQRRRAAEAAAVPAAGRHGGTLSAAAAR